MNDKKHLIDLQNKCILYYIKLLAPGVQLLAPGGCPAPCTGCPAPWTGCQ